MPERTAVGDVADLYAEIRRTLGTTSVALVYRVVAATPRRLRPLWESLAPNLGSAEAWASARTLAPPDIGLLWSVPVGAIRGAGLDREAAEGTIADFHHANCINFLGLLSLLHGAKGGRPGSPAAARLSSVRTLPMADLATLPQATVQLLERMSTQIAGDEGPLLIPSLLRCFAHDERLLASIWRSIGPAVRSSAFTTAINAVTAQAVSAARTLPYRTCKIEDDETRAIVTRFCRVIPRMIVAGSLVSQSLSENDAPPAYQSC